MQSLKLLVEYNDKAVFRGSYRNVRVENTVSWNLQFRASEHEQSQTRMTDFKQSFMNFPRFEGGERTYHTFFLIRSKEGRVAGVYATKEIPVGESSQTITNNGGFIVAFGVNFEAVNNAVKADTSLNKGFSKSKLVTYVEADEKDPWRQSYFECSPPKCVSGINYHVDAGPSFGRDDKGNAGLSIAWGDWKKVNSISKTFNTYTKSGLPISKFTLFGKGEFKVEDYEIWTVSYRKETFEGNE